MNRFWVLFLVATSASIAIADQPTVPNSQTENSPADKLAVRVDLTRPLETLAGELLADRNLSEDEFAKLTEKIVIRSRKLYRDKILPHSLAERNVKTAQELDQLLVPSGSSVSKLEDQFVWRLLIGELNRKCEAVGASRQ